MTIEFLGAQSIKLRDSYKAANNSAHDAPISYYITPSKQEDQHEI